MAANTNPRRRPAGTGPSIDTLADSMNNITISKASTFQPSSKQDAAFWTPFLNDPTAPTRSPTCPKALEELLMGSGERRAIELIQKVEKARAAPSTFHLQAVLNEDEVLPVDNNASAIASRRSSLASEDLSESEIDSLMSSPATEVSDDLDIDNFDNNKYEAAYAEAIGRRGVHRFLSDHARKQVFDFVIKPILQQPVFKDYHRLIRQLPRKIDTREIRTVRDLEKSIIFQAPDYSRSANAYRSFCEISIRCLQLTVEAVHDNDKCLPTERPYTPSYFSDLVQQIRRYAQILAATRAKQARGESLGPKDITMSDKIELKGGLSHNGKPAVLAVVKEEEVISMADNKAMTSEQVAAGKRPSINVDFEADSAARSMARRKKGEPRRSYPCPHAGCTKPPFNRPCDLTKHLKTHERPFKCPELTCKFHTLGWPTEKECERHYNDKHAVAPKLYTCPHCPEGQYKTKRESNLKQHLEQNHGIPYIRSKGNGKRKASDVTNLAKPSPSIQTDSNFNSPLPLTAFSPSVGSTVSVEQGAQSVPYLSPEQGMGIQSTPFMSPSGQPYAFDFDFSGFGNHFNMNYLQPSPSMSAVPGFAEDRNSVATSVTDYSPMDMQMPDFDHTAFKTEPVNYDYNIYDDENFKQLLREVTGSDQIVPQYQQADMAPPTGTYNTTAFSPVIADPMINGVTENEPVGMPGDFQLFANAPINHGPVINGVSTSFDEMLDLQAQERQSKQWNLFPELYD